MAHIFAGADRRQLDPEVLEAFKALSDDFWVFAEFTLSRNIDWFIVHPHPSGTLALIAIELKRTGQPFTGDLNNAWKQWSPEGWRDLVLSGPYRNYYWQAIEAANTLKEWLWKNQRRYRANQALLPQEAFKVWPDLLILSPPGTKHLLPLQPPNNFGKLLYSLDECVRHVASWKSRQLALVPLAGEEMVRLAEALGLEQIWPLRDRDDREHLLGRIRLLEERIRRLEAALAPDRIPGDSVEPAFDRPVALPSPPGFAFPGAAPALSLLSNNAAGLADLALDGPTVPPLETVLGWIEETLRNYGQGQPVRFADLGNALKSRNSLDARAQFGLSLTELLQQAEQAGRVRLFQRDRVPYAALASDPPSILAPTNGAAPPEAVSVRQRLGKEGLMATVRIIAAVEDAADGRVVQTASLLKHLRESLPLNGGPTLSNSEANRLLKRELVGLDYLKPVPVRDFDLDSGNLQIAAGYRLNREHLAVQIMLDTGAAILSPAVEVRAFATPLTEVALSGTD
jgi:hypothetical protein